MPRYILNILTLIICLVVGSINPAMTQPAQHSRLCNGKWIKIATTQPGVHCIDAATLRNWGFDDASQVSLYGKDGYMLSERFGGDDCDDLQPLPTFVADGNLYFYASGSIRWDKPSGSTFFNRERNYYSEVSFYFLTQDGSPTPLDTHSQELDKETPITTFDERLLHEEELTSISQTGRLYLGQDLKKEKELTLHAPGITGEKLTMTIAIGANTTSTLTLTTHLNGTALSPNIAVGATDTYTYLREAYRTYTIDTTDTLNLSFTTAGVGAINALHLDYVLLHYTRALQLNDAQMSFRNNNLSGTYYAIDINDRQADKIKVWDVTDVNRPFAHATTLVDEMIAFTPSGNNDDCREYVVFDLNDNTLPLPQYVGIVPNQDIHGSDYIPDMVIVTTQYYLNEAERIAKLHRDNDNMKVLVCDQIAVFNEFSGGNPDATAIRRMMKMFYDRAQAGHGNTPRYLLLYGQAYYDNRAITHRLHTPDNTMLISYHSKNSTDRRYAYVSDDYYGMLDDNSGVDITAEVMRIAIGRIPVRNLEQAQQVYKKLSTYISQKPTNNLWKNKCCMIGLNGDNNLHIRQANYVSVNTVERNQQHMVVDKIYMSAYNSTANEKYVGAQEQIFRDLEEGTMLYNYMGHAGHLSIGSDLISINHAKEMSNTYWPVFITATCDVCPYDKDENSVGEELFRNEKGGFIALFTTGRTVYTDGNDDINRELMREFFIPDAEGKIRLGDVIRRAKENLHTDTGGNVISDSNKLKYFLVGDPALAIPLPTYDIRVTDINSTTLQPGTTIAVEANSEVTISGAIYDTDGNIAHDFNGTLCYEVYDAATQENSTEKMGTTLIQEKFLLRKYKLVTAADTIINGTFTTTFRLPAQCLQSDSTALISLYAYNEAMNIEAKGYSNDMIINGFQNASPDIQAPTITHIWIGNEDFNEGDAVERNSTFHCDLYDTESGLCYNEITIGKLMTLWLDGKIVCNDLSGHYTPHKGQSKGSIDYDLKNLTTGSHSITIRVFDNAGNSSEATTTFTVENNITTAYEITVVENPIITQATLSIEGVIEEGMLIRYIVAESATGKEVWNTLTSQSETVWDVHNSLSTIQPGEYICYAIISHAGNEYVTPSKKIIILRQ